MIQTADSQTRKELYRLLALIFSGEPDGSLVELIKDPNFLGSLGTLDVTFETDFSSTPTQELVAELSEEYTRLFLGPQGSISPHESVHQEYEGSLWGSSTAAVKAFIEASGMKYRSDFTGIPDHISVELEFMHRLIDAELQAAQDSDEQQRERVLELEQRFLKEHILQWVPGFADKVAARGGSFYGSMAKLTKEFVLAEDRLLSKELAR